MFKFWKSGSSGPTLSDLPRDLVINELLQWLQPEDLCDISQTCKGLSYLRHDNAAWFKILSEFVQLARFVLFSLCLPKLVD
jgi:hypothetical protein